MAQARKNEEPKKHDCSLTKDSCQLCLERFCRVCDSNHREACRDANRP